MMRRHGWWRRLGRLLAAGSPCWQLWTSAARSAFFPPPSAIVARMYHLWFSGPATHLFLTADATGNILPSLGRVFAGLAIATVGGRPLGIALGRSPAVTAYLDPLLQFARALPVVTMAPVFIVLFKLGTQMEVATIVFGTVWPILLNTIDGAGFVDPVQLETARAFRLPGGSGWPADHPGRAAEVLRRVPAEPVAGPDPDGVRRAGRQQRRHRLRDEQRDELVRHDLAVVDDRAARHPRLPAQRAELAVEHRRAGLAPRARGRRGTDRCSR